MSGTERDTNERNEEFQITVQYLIISDLNLISKSDKNEQVLRYIEYFQSSQFSKKRSRGEYQRHLRDTKSKGSPGKKSQQASEADIMEN